ncbi:MAG TPA: hypothetical protein VII12_13630 [Thermoanaerobaculia bacterium]
MSARRWIAAVSLIFVALTEIAPHRHADSILDLTLGSGGEAHIIRCESPASGVPHLHRDRVRHIDPCVACFRQHMQATASSITLGAPQILQQTLIVVARVAHARAIELRKSSRGPPILFS